MRREDLRVGTSYAVNRQRDRHPYSNKEMILVDKAYGWVRSHDYRGSAIQVRVSHPAGKMAVLMCEPGHEHDVPERMHVVQLRHIIGLWSIAVTDMAARREQQARVAQALRQEQQRNQELFDAGKAELTAIGAHLHEEVHVNGYKNDMVRMPTETFHDLAVMAKLWHEYAQENQ